MANFKRYEQQRGFAYIVCLFILATTATGLLIVAQAVSTSVKREKETELLYAGNAIAAGIKSYRLISPGTKKTHPAALEYLLSDLRFVSWPPPRHLRKIYRDPMTKDGKWGLILDNDGNITGVHSLSENKPLKTGNFSRLNKDFKGKKKYSDWRFIHE